MIFVIAIVLFIYMGIRWRKNYINAKKNYNETIGTIVEYVRRVNNPFFCYNPVVRYIVNSIEYKIVYRKHAYGHYEKLKMNNIGKERKVYYNPNNPNDACVEGENPWTIYFILAIPLIIIIIVAFIKTYL